MSDEFTSERFEALAKKQAGIAVEVSKIPCCGKPPAGAKHCVQAEENRPLTPAEKKKGWARRPFDLYDDARMCEPCSAYWHASVSQVRLHGLARRERMIESEG